MSSWYVLGMWLLGAGLLAGLGFLIWRAMDVVEIGGLKVPKKDFYDFERLIPHILAPGYCVSTFFDAPDVLKRLLELRPPWFSHKPGTPFTSDRICLLGAEQENFELLLRALDWGPSSTGLRLAYLTGTPNVRLFLHKRSPAIREMFPDPPSTSPPRAAGALGPTQKEGCVEDAAPKEPGSPGISG